MKGRRQIITYSLGFRVGKCNNNQLNMPNNKAHMLGGVNHRIYTQTLEILRYLLWIVIRIARNCLFWTDKSIVCTLKVKLMFSHFYLILTIKLLLWTLQIKKVKLFVCFAHENKRGNRYPKIKSGNKVRYQKLKRNWTCTGKSFSEALILASTNPQYIFFQAGTLKKVGCHTYKWEKNQASTLKKSG